MRCRWGCRAVIGAGLVLMIAGGAQAQGSLARSAASVMDLRVEDAAVLKSRDALLARGEALLASGEPAQAIEAFDQAAMMLHAGDTEMALVRAYMQGGEYRRALAFAAHMAGAHVDEPAGSALYAWLLSVGGQAVYALRQLDEALMRVPDDAVLLGARLELSKPAPVARGLLLDAPHRVAPSGVMRDGTDALPARARVVATAVLIEDGRVLLPRNALGKAQTFWLRNGLGETVRATRQGDSSALLRASGLAIARPSAGLSSGVSVQGAPRDPFAGSPGYIVAYGASQEPTPAWPWLHPGFLGAATGDGVWRRPGIELPAGQSSGPVFDSAGRLAGIVVPRSEGGAFMLPISALREAIPGSFTSIDAAQGASLPMDEIYERSLRSTMQVLVADDL